MQRTHIRTAPSRVLTQFQLLPRFGTVEYTQAKVQRTFKHDGFIPKLIPSAFNPEHTHKTRGLKPYPRPIATMGQGLTNDTAGLFPHQGYARHQKRGLSYMQDGRDKTIGRAVTPPDSQFADRDNKLGLPR